MCGRTWEIMACNRLCFAYFNPDTMFKSATYFKDAEDLVYFRTYDELYEKYQYYLQHLEEAQRIAKSGYNKVRAFHNQNVRVGYILDCMATEYEKWLTDQENIPLELRELYANI